MPRKRETPHDRLFAALGHASDALIDAMEKANQRGYRVSRTTIREARKGGREVLGMTRKWTEQPADITQLYEVQLDVQTRGLELVRQWLDEAGGVQTDMRETLQRLLIANIAAGQAVSAIIRRTPDGARPADAGEGAKARPPKGRAKAATRAATAPRGRRTAPKPKETSKAKASRPRKGRTPAATTTAAPATSPASG